MTLSLFEPVREGLTLREAINRLFEDSVVPAATSPARGMALDILETPDEIIVKASLAGADKEKVDIQFQENTLTLKATLNGDAAPESARYLLSERFSGQLTRTVTLPTTVDADKATANFKDGVLILTLPKSEAVKPRTIRVN